MANKLCPANKAHAQEVPLRIEGKQVEEVHGPLLTMASLSQLRN